MRGVCAFPYAGKSAQKGVMAMAGVLTIQDRIALVEIELCGELMIAAAASLEERLSQARIDEVLMVRTARSTRTAHPEGCVRARRDRERGHEHER